ncbi:hypothetical protein [Deinococcus roseus]|uniref:Uncharacterized protein n=1 Tax=Deinococcus roseus TaxID=392414 RepID=A0ABQ2CTA8_9DEIO|nr:hypothetical protein [Deinococcus roseus]GGJ18967.1 hypothetical protein GCM10008938_01220 [Deinococcus roseus]
MKKHALVPLLCMLLGNPVLAAPKPEVPSGWSATQTEEVWTLVPNGLKKDQVFLLQVFPTTSLNGKDLQTWGKSFIQKSSSALGKSIQPLSFQQEEGFLVGSTGVMVQNQPLVLIYAVVGTGEDQAQVFLMVSSPDASLGQAYGKVLPDLIATAVRQNQNPPDPMVSGTSTGFNLPAGAKPGGKLDFGAYTCTKLFTDGDKNTYTLQLYENGEYRVGKDSTGNFKYQSQTGRIDIDVLYDLVNSADGDDLSVHYRDRNSRSVIYAENDYGLGIWKTTCLYAGENTIPSPTAQAAEEKRQEAEKNRFKWVTAPGKGVQASQMEALVIHYENEYDPRTLLTLPVPHLALLLKDGTAYLGLRVPPEDLDLQTSRKNEPEQWTKWKKTGKNILLLVKNKWTGFEADPVFPAKNNEKLNGEFKHMKSSYNFVLGGTTSSTFFTFDAKGKFEISTSSLFSTGNLQSINGESVSSASFRDREGSSGSTGYAGGNINGEGPTVVSSVQHNNQTPNPDMAGSYTLNGYTLQLKLGNGQVVRKLFFFFDDKKEDFWIEDASYYPSDRYE